MGIIRGLNWASVLLASLVILADGLRVEISAPTGNSLLSGQIDGRVVLMFAPNGTDPLDDIEVTSTPNHMFGKNVFGFGAGDTITLSGGKGDGDNATTATGVYGFPLVSMDELPAGVYRVQAFLTPYDRAERSDGSVVHLKFPCGDGAPQVNGVGSLVTPAVDTEVVAEDKASPQTINLAFDTVAPVEAFRGREIGKCSQGNYADTELLKYVKIRSAKLSAFWGRDMYVGATVLLPAGYDATDNTTRYPVLYSQGHWPGGKGPFNYPTAAFSKAWDAGVIPGNNNETAARDRPTPKLILVRFRHEAPFYDDSYGVNTANLGPYGDALNDELIPHLDSLFHTVVAPHARIQEGGSTGGWISAASVVFRPDLFGACFSSYPDSLRFQKHQDIALYTNANAYRNADGSRIGSIREFDGDAGRVLATVEQENHWELVFGTASRSALQWDAWNAVFGAQGLNGYPLEPWDKVTGEIYPESVAYWKALGMDLAEYIASNWNNTTNGTGKNLGEALKNRLFVYVGTHDDYYLNEGVAAFERRVNAPELGGPGWANVTITPGATHGGNYQRREIWDYLELVTSWVRDHGPEGATPLSAEAVSPRNRGNRFEEDVMRIGGRAAAIARQADPFVEVQSVGGGSAKCGGPKVVGTVGRWDPGVELEAQWVVDGAASGTPFAVKQSDSVRYTPGNTQAKKGFSVSLRVKGTKRNYKDDVRESGTVTVMAKRR
ncbi:Alpha/Beta hydrolase protein [Apiospora arundinis]